LLLSVSLDLKHKTNDIARFPLARLLS